MAKKREIKLTPLEALIMDCVWDLSSATVRQVQDRLKRAKPMAYNTVLTMMGILREKGFLRSRRGNVSLPGVSVVDVVTLLNRKVMENCKNYDRGQL